MELYKIITDEEFIKICESAETMHKASIQLGYSSFNSFMRKAKKLNCYYPNQGGKGTIKKLQGVPLEEILDGLHPEYQTYKLKTRLIESGIKEDKCELCGWNLKPENAKYTPCELHHKDGNPHNHSLSNLILLCPNCHSLTKNYRFRKRALK